MLVLQHEATLQRLLHPWLFRLVVPVGAIGDDGSDTLQAQALRISEIGLFHAPCSDPVGLGYPTVDLSQHFLSLPRSVLGVSKCPNRLR